MSQCEQICQFICAEGESICSDIDSLDNCFERLGCTLFTQRTVDLTAADSAIKDFLLHFENPEPIIEEIGNIVVGFGERTVLYIFAAIFVVAILFIWYMVIIDIMTWQAAILLTIILIVVLLIFLILYTASIRAYLEDSFIIITNSLEHWLESQKSKIIPAASDAACFYVEQVS